VDYIGVTDNMISSFV